MDEYKKKLEKTSELVDTLIMISTELIKEVNELEERIEKLEKSNSMGHNHIGRLTERVSRLEYKDERQDMKIKEHERKLYKPENIDFDDFHEFLKNIRW